MLHEWTNANNEILNVTIPQVFLLNTKYDALGLRYLNLR